VRRFIELNHVLRDGMATYPGLPEARIEALHDHDSSASRYDGHAEFYLGRVEMPCNVGTYLDSPFHRFREGADLSRLPLEKIAGLEGIVLDARVAGDRSVSADCEDAELAGRAVLLRSGWDARWGRTEYWDAGPFLSAGLTGRLLDAGAALVGVDFWNVDDILDLRRPAHTRLLEAGVPIVEHLANLAALPRTGFRFWAVPPRIERGASFPVRAFAELG
jgi:arylformamidase